MMTDISGTSGEMDVVWVEEEEEEEAVHEGEVSEEGGEEERLSESCISPLSCSLLSFTSSQSSTLIVAPGIDLMKAAS
jgi:hypothetical protein